MRELRISYVEHLEFLRPLAPFVFLHDNDNQAHTPPAIVLTNVTKVTWAPGLFDKAAGRCRTKQQTLEDLHFENVQIPTMPANLFRNQTIKTFTMLNVNISSMETQSLHIAAAKFSIINSSLPIIPSQAFFIQSDMVNKLSLIAIYSIRS